MNPKVDVYLSDSDPDRCCDRQNEMEQLRMVVLACGRTESLKN
jgi:hypothetical protein